MHVLAATCAVMCVGLRAGRTQEPTPTVGDARVTRLQLSGQVLNECGQPITNASVFLVAAWGPQVHSMAELDPDWPWLHAHSNEQGRFELGFSADDQRFLTPGSLLVVTRASGYQLRLERLPMARLQVDVPIAVRLDEATPVTIDAVSDTGRSLASGAIYPASIRGQHVPWAIASQLNGGAVDTQGHARLDECAPESLDAVFLVGTGADHHRLPVTPSSAGEPQVTIPPTRAIRGTITSPQRDAVPGVGDVKMFIASYPSGTVGSVNDLIQCSWTIVPVNAQGEFQTDALAIGRLTYQISCPADFPFRETRTGVVTILESGNDPYCWAIPFEKQAKLKAKVIDASTGDPLPNLYISCWDGRVERTYTNGNGEAAFFRTHNSVSYFPFDATEEYFSTDAFYADSEKLPAEGEIELEPIGLVRSSRWQGCVLDERGEWAAGSRVEFEYARERSRAMGVAYSDLSGRFRVRGVAERTGLSLRAIRDNAASEFVDVTFPPKEAVELRLISRPAAAPIGRIVDTDGRPIAGVEVAIRTGRVHEKEHFGREVLIPDVLYPTEGCTRTDRQGRFQFPPTIDFARRMQIQIRDPRCFPFYSPFIDGSKIARAGDSGQLNLGDFQVMNRPLPRQISITVQSQTGQGLANAHVVVVGARTGTARGTTDAQGQVQLDARSGQAIVAILAEGCAVYFAKAPEADSSWRFTLQSAEQAATEGDRASTWDVPPSDFLAAAEQVFAVMERPELKSSTLHRIRMYVDALASLNPDECLQYILVNLPQNPQLAQFALAGAANAISRRPEMVELLEKIPFVPAEQRCHAFLQAAIATDDAGMRDEWLGEALVAARNTSGRSRLLTMPRVAQTLLGFGRAELAKQVVNEAWSSASELQELVQAGKRRQMVGESRIFCTMLAIVDLDKALKAIELTALENEIAHLKTEAILNWGQTNPQALAAGLQDASWEPMESRGVNYWLSRVARISATEQTGLSTPREVARLIPDVQTRLRFLLFHARISANPAVRDELLQLAIAVIGELPPNEEEQLQLAQLLLPELRRFRHIDRRNLDTILFYALWNMPLQFDTYRTHTALGEAAELLALRDRRLARELLEPCLRDLGWLFLEWQLGLGSQEPILATARIDPNWSVEVVNRLCQETLQQQPAEQLELRSAVIGALTTPLDDIP
jgi:hypothetical protein